MKKLVFTLVLFTVLILGAETVLISHKDMQMSERQEVSGKDYTKENELNKSLQVEKIMKLYRQMYSAIITKDMDAVTKIFASDFVMFYLNGINMNKNQCLTAIKDGTLSYSRANHDDIVVNVYGDHATICGKTSVDIGNNVKKIDLHIQQDITLEKRNGRWVFTSSKASIY